MDTTENQNLELLKWAGKDSFQDMTKKHNQVVDQLEVNNQVYSDTKAEIDNIKTDVSNRLSKLTKKDVGLGNVDNTTDKNKPVSTQQKQYVDNEVKKLKEAIATEAVLGRVKASEEVSVDPLTGKMSVPRLSEMGSLEELGTESKSTLVDAINEVFTLGNENKNKLVENLIAMGVDCSTTDTWESLIAKVLTIFTGVDTSDATAVDSDTVQGKTFYSSEGTKITGSMPNRSDTVANGGQADDYVSATWSNQAINHSTLTQFGLYGSDNINKLIMRPPTGWYSREKEARVYATSEEVAAALGLTSEKIVSGVKVCDITGTGDNVQFTLIQQNTGNSITTTWHSWDVIKKYNAILIQFYDQSSFKDTTTASVIGTFCMTYSDMVNNLNQIPQLTDSQKFSMYLDDGIYGYVFLSKTQGLRASRYQERYGYRILGISGGFNIPARNAYN